MPPSQILYCHCAYAKVVPPEVKRLVLEKLTESNQAFDAVADLCEMSAKGDPVLQQLAGQPGLKIVACYPRAVKWLFSAAGVKLPEEVPVLNMRTQPAEEILVQLLVPPALTSAAHSSSESLSDAAVAGEASK